MDKAIEAARDAVARVMTGGTCEPGQFNWRTPLYQEGVNPLCAEIAQASIAAHNAASDTVQVPRGYLRQLKREIDNGEIGDAERTMDALIREVFDHKSDCAVTASPDYDPADCTCGAMLAAHEEKE